MRTQWQILIGELCNETIEPEHEMEVLRALKEYVDFEFHSARTKAGLERQKINHTPGPNGHHGPGQPRAKFDHDLARRLREQGHSYTEMANRLGISRITAYRFVKRERESQP